MPTNPLPFESPIIGKAIGDVRAELLSALGRLDELGLFHAGAYLSMSIDCLENSLGPSMLRDGSEDEPYRP